MLDRDEYHAMIYPIDSTVDHDKEVTETLRTYDADNDGYITFKEYRGTGSCVAWGVCSAELSGSR